MRCLSFSWIGFKPSEVTAEYVTKKNSQMFFVDCFLNRTQLNENKQTNIENKQDQVLLDKLVLLQLVS